MKQIVCFIFAFGEGIYKTHNEFQKYRMKWKFISDSFYHIFNSLKFKNIEFLSSFISDVTMENAS